jgi:hypothetical protein
MSADHTVNKNRDYVLILLIAALQQCHDEAAHAIGTESDNPGRVWRVNARAIRRIAKSAIHAAKKGGR